MLIEITHKSNNVFCKDECCLCHQWFEAWSFLAQATHDGEHVGHVCDDCMTASEPELRERLRQAAEWAAARAKDAEALCTATINRPSRDRYLREIEEMHRRAEEWHERTIEEMKAAGATPKELEMLAPF